MTEWTSITDFGLAGLIIAGLVYVAVTYLKERKIEQQPKSGLSPISQDHKARSCSDSLQGFLIENTKVTSELMTMMRQQHDNDREWIRCNQEAMQGLVLAINNVVMTSKEILDRVKELDRRNHNE